MADKLKVFKNEVNQTVAATLSAAPINVLTTDATTQAVIKDVDVSISHPNPLYREIYKYPLKAKVGNFPVAESTSGRMVLSGSQIVDSNSSFSLEIQPEPQRIDYGKLEMILPVAGDSSLFEYSINNVGDPSGKGLTILSNIKPLGVTLFSSAIIANTGCTIVRNGELLYCYANGTDLVVINRLGQTQATLPMPVTTHAICADSTFIYGKSNTTNNIIYRWSISSLTQTTDLFLNLNVNGFPSSNPGFIDHYNGSIYIRSNGIDGAIRVIDTSTGVVTSINTVSQTEHIGGLITVNTSGVPFLVEYQDTQWLTINLNTMAVQTFSGVFPTDPTTTSGNRAAVIANGIVLFNNGTYSTTAIVDVNGTTPVASLATAAFPMGQANRVMISKPFQTTPVPVAREISYSLLASGVESTN
jgi:hypothetical protein